MPKMGIRRRDVLKVVGATVAGAAATKMVQGTAEASQKAPIVRDVCVIGGGSAGSYTAVRLRDLGKSVVVLERKGRLGGHAETVVDPVTGTPIDIGVVVFENNALVQNYFGRFNVPIFPIQFPPGQTTYADFRTGKVVAYTPPGPAEFGQAFGTYLQVLATQFPYLDSGFNLPNPVPADLYLPFGQFVTKYNLAALVPTAFAFGEGLGTILNDPALYVLKNFSLSVAGSLAQGAFVIVPGGTAQIYDKIAASLGSDAIFDANVLRVNRSGGSYIEVDVQTPNGIVQVHCKKLVVAFPPSAEGLCPFDLDALESSTLSRFKAKYYATALVKIDGITPGLTVQNVGADTTYNLAALPGIYSLAPTQVPGLYNVKYGSDVWLPDAIVKAQIVADIAKLKWAGTVPAVFKGFIAFSSHAPFELMVSPAEISGGFYNTLNSLQGRHNTYYTGAAFQTNDSSLIWQFTESLLPQIAS